MNPICLAALLFLPLAQQSTDPALLQTLLTEVHALRLAIERSSTLAPRIQLALARYQMQQERVLRKEKDLEVVRTQIQIEGQGKERLQATLRQFEDQARQAPDGTMRKQFEEAATNARFDQETQAAREMQARAQESAISNDLRIEQAKLNEIATQLDQLEKRMNN